MSEILRQLNYPSAYCIADCRAAGNNVGAVSFGGLSMEGVATAEILVCWYRNAYNCTNVQLYNCAPVQLHNCTTVKLYNCTTVQLYNYTAVQLYNCTIVQM